jgi:ACS family hexuronate transporter-like MFS transporter
VPVVIAGERAETIGRVRWGICALLFCATTLNYIDRSVLGILAPTLRTEIGWTDGDYGRISGAFTLAYAIGFLFAGRFIDRVGTRAGYALYLMVWSIAAAAHALASTPLGFMAARFALGLGESGNFPAAIKSVAAWFPRRERAFATGVFNAGSNVGSIIAPLVVPWLTLRWSWQLAFAATGLIGIAWVFVWWPLYREPHEHPRLGEAERLHIASDPPEPEIAMSWLDMVRHRQAWAFAIGKLLTDAVWWFYLFWFPLFMADTFGVDLAHIGTALITVYVLADVGSVAGGWFSSALLKRGWTVNAARKTAMLVCALLILPVIMAPRVANPWVAVWLVGLATAAHQGFSANIFTLTSDMFPKGAVATVVGFGGFAGGMAGFLMNLGAGWFRDNHGSYATMFTMAGVAYLIALAFIHLLAPRLEPVRIRART